MPNTSRSYCFTYFKLPELIEKHCNKLATLKKFRYLIAQLEQCPTSNRIHIQGYIEFNGKQSIREIQKLCPGIHLEIRRGTRQQARDYCKKTETSVGTVIELGEFKTEQGKRNDIERIKEAFNNGDNLPDIVWNIATNLQSIKIAEKLLEYKQEKRDPMKPPEIRWYYGETGTGKTKSVYDEFESDEIYSSTTFKWWNGYYQQKCILIDDMRKDYAKFHQLLRLLDRYPIQVQTKGGHAQINSPVIIITSAYHPKDLYDTREDIQQLLRRITTIKQFGKYDMSISSSASEASSPQEINTQFKIDW